MKWIGQHIWDFISRFRSDVYLEDLTESTQDHVVGIAADGKLYKQDVSVGDITGVTITTDSGGGSAASETSGSADFSILGSNGVGVTNSGTTITATAVPGEIDHDSLLNFVAAEHYNWSSDISGTATVHTNNITDLHGAGVDGSANQLLTDDGDGTITSELTATLATTLSETNLKLFSPADSGDYLHVATKASGETDITTVDGGAAAAHLNLTADGNITLDAGAKQTYIKRGGASFINFNYNTARYIQHSVLNASDLFEIIVAAEGATTIQTTDADTTAGHISIIPDGDLYFVPANRNVNIGGDNNSSFVLQRQAHSDGGGGDLAVKGGSATDGVSNMEAGSLSFYTGQQTGNAAPGKFQFHSTLQNVSSGGTIRSTSLISELYTGLSTTEQRWYEAGGASTDDYLKLVVAANGATTLATIDGGGTNANLTLDVDGDIEINADGGDIDFKDASLTLAKINSTDGIFVGQMGGSNSHLTFETDTENVILQAPADAATAERTITLPDATGTAALSESSAGKQYWHHTFGGYKQSVGNTTTYYFQYRNGNDAWNNSDSSISSISQYDSYAGFLVAPRDGTIENVKIVGYTSGVVSSGNDFAFYFKKAASSNGASSVSVTDMVNTSDITPDTTSGRTFSHTEDFSSNNSFSEGDVLYCFLKKSSSSGNTHFYFTLTISGYW